MSLINSLNFALLALAVYRLSYLISREEGPFSLAYKFRQRFDPLQRTWVGRGLNCVMCVSFWVALVASWLWTVGAFDNPFSQFVVIWLALSAVTVVITKLSKS